MRKLGELIALLCLGHFSYFGMVYSASYTSHTAHPDQNTFPLHNRMLLDRFKGYIGIRVLVEEKRHGGVDQLSWWNESIELGMTG